MTQDENKIGDLIEGGLHQKEQEEIQDDFVKSINIALDYWKQFDGEKQKGIVYGLGLALEKYLNLP